MKFLSPTTEAMASITLAHAALITVSERNELSEADYQRVYGHLKNAMSALRGRHPIPDTNPCAEILLRSTRPDND